GGGGSAVGAQLLQGLPEFFQHAVVPLFGQALPHLLQPGGGRGVPRLGVGRLAGGGKGLFFQRGFLSFRLSMRVPSARTCSLCRRKAAYCSRRPARPSVRLACCSSRAARRAAGSSSSAGAPV